MDNNLLKYLAFVETVDKGSFTKAANSLNYAQSSISKMIADLEKEWGFPLLERNKKGVCLTSSGKQLLPYARKILSDFEEMQQQVHAINGIQSGTVRIGTFSSVAINWLPNIFSKFQEDYPKIDYEILLGDYDDIEKWIDEGRVDCGFLRLPSCTNFDIISLKQDEYKAVLPMNHPLAQKDFLDYKDLNEQPFLLLEHGGKTEVSELLEKYNIHPNIRFTTWEDYAIMSMVEKGLGIGVLPEMILKRIPYQVAIRPFRTPYFREIVLAMKDQKKMTPAIEKFIEYLKYRERIPAI
ncbi:MAG: LysR family transcriptional regulator [Eubacterium sp.]|nr:LysR family transcriptional regulator [Eubacterium sp.]